MIAKKRKTSERYYTKRKCVICQEEFLVRKKSRSAAINMGVKTSHIRPRHAVTCSKKCSRENNGKINNLDTFYRRGLVSLFLVFIFLISFASAQDTNTVQSLGRYSNGACVNVIQLCSNCTFNNITSIIVSPVSSTALGSAKMTKQGTSYNYTFCNTTMNGQYIVNGFGDLNGNNVVWSYNFTIGGSLVVFLILCFTALAILALAFVTQNEYLGFIAGAILIVAGVYAMINGIAEIADDYTRMLALIIIGIGIMFEISVGYQIYSSGEDE